jgi:hypothetical protein
MTGASKRDFRDIYNNISHYLSPNRALFCMFSQITWLIGSSRRLDLSLSVQKPVFWILTSASKEFIHQIRHKNANN